MADDFDPSVTIALATLLDSPSTDPRVLQARDLLLDVVQGKPLSVAASPPDHAPVAPADQELTTVPIPNNAVLDAVRAARAQVEASGYPFHPRDNPPPPDPGAPDVYPLRERQRALYTTIIAAAALARQFPSAVIGVELYTGPSGVVIDGVSETLSFDIILVGTGSNPGDYSIDVLGGGVDPQVLIGNAAAAGTWRPVPDPATVRIPYPPPEGQDVIPDTELDRMLGILTHYRAMKGETLTNDECVALLNQTAFHLSRSGQPWGVLAKPDGNNGRRRDGVLCSVDHLVHRPTLIGLDVLASAGAGGPSSPTIGAQEAFPLSRFHAAIEPADTDLPPDEEGDAIARLERIERKVNDLFKLHNDLILAIGNTLMEQGQFIGQSIENENRKVLEQLGKGYAGTARIPVLGTVKFDLTPKP